MSSPVVTSVPSVVSVEALVSVVPDAVVVVPPATVVSVPAPPHAAARSTSAAMAARVLIVFMDSLLQVHRPSAIGAWKSSR
jgi:hypothetical protein